VFVCENNLYGASTRISETLLIEDIAKRAAGYGIPGVTVDGMDVLAVHGAATKAVARARKGDGPTLIECKTYRYSGHSRGDPCGYRDKEELARWKETRDPIRNFSEVLLSEFGLEQEDLDRIEQACKQEIEEAVEFARSSPDPAPETCFEHVYTP